ncbi:MAG TPA: hypothetical protein VKV95_16460 [Terriglobia bacterium]|nr:hypothetical protein [Terriglobia bacterium]
MNPVAIKLSSVALLGAASLAGTAGVITYNAGAVRVSVVEKRQNGEHVHVFVPAIVIPMAMGFIPAKHFHVHDKDTHQWLPILKAVSQELERCPDATLVEVTSPDEHVKISKQGNSLYIDVDDPGETVHVSFPVGVVQTVVNKLEAANTSPPV